MRTIVVTVGTSLLTNLDTHLPQDKRRPWAGWRHGKELPQIETLIEFLKVADERVASAETHTLYALPLQDDDHIVFLHTETDDGKICAEALKASYGFFGYSVEAKEITGLRYDEKSFAERGLKTLVSTLFDVIRKAQEHQRRVVFCATGGFKAEIAFINLVGMLMGIEVYYIYEAFDQLIKFPAFPISWNLEFVERNIKFFEWIDEEPRKSIDVESWLSACPELRSLVSQDDEGFTMLTAAGDMLFKAYKQGREMGLPKWVWPTRTSDKLPRDKIGLSGVGHSRPDGYERFVDQLATIGYVDRIRYDGSAPSGTRRPGVSILNPSEGILRVVYERGGKVLPLIVETTADNESECQTVAEYISNMLRRR